MKKFFQEKPWYFAIAVLGFILKPILEWFVMFFLTKTLQKNG